MTLAEAKEMWDEHDTDNRVERDWHGRRNQKRLWLLKHVFKDDYNGTTYEGGTEESSNSFKAPTADLRDAFRRHVHEDSTGLGHEMFQGRSFLAARAGEKPDMDVDEESAVSGN